MDPDPHQNTTQESDPTDMVEQDFGGDQAATTAVIEAVAAISGTDPLELPPLYDAIDPEALDALFESHDPPGDSDLRVMFSYNGFTIIVRDDSTITIQET